MVMLHFQQRLLREQEELYRRVAALRHFQQRLLREQKELDRRVAALTVYIRGETRERQAAGTWDREPDNFCEDVVFASLSDAEKARLTRQVEAMEHLSSILSERVDAALDEDEETHAMGGGMVDAPPQCVT